jgi:hypothetical protein
LLHTFRARLIVPLSSSELDVRASAHIQRCGQTPRRYGVYSRCCSLPTMGQPLPLVPDVAPTPSWARELSAQVTSDLQDKRMTHVGYISHAGYRLLYPFGLLPRARRRGAIAGAGVGGGVPAERIPRVTPPNLARRGEVVNKIKKTKKLGIFITGCIPKPTGGCQMCIATR